MVLMILLTTAVGFHLGLGALESGPIREGFSDALSLLLPTLLGTALLAAAAFGFNQAWEKDLDALMERTRNRPLPTGRLTRTEAVVFSSLLTLAGALVLAVFVNLLTMALGLLTVVLYAAVYTPLKRISSLNTLIGAIPGALPPLMGWTAAQGLIGFGGAVLFLLLFFWQTPHFLSLAWLYREEYRRGGFRMLSVTDPSGEACFRHIVLQTVFLLFVSLLPFVAGLAGKVYLLSALSAGAYFLFSALRLYRLRTQAAARTLFLASLVYLPLVLVVLALNRLTVFL